MKILHKSKKVVPPHPQVNELINKIVDTSNEELSDVLEKYESWQWPRSDLNNWIKVLNKFDGIMEEVIRDYDVDKVQVNDFTPRTKKTMCEILRFERLLLENSNNRKIFASYDRLNSLMSTADSDVLVLALNLLLRPSQQYSAQPSVAQALNISTSRLQSLSKRWPNLREFEISIVDLTTDKGKARAESLPTEAREVNFTFYRRDWTDKPKEQDKDKEVPPPPRKTQDPVPTAANSGAVLVHIDARSLETKRTMDILADAVDAFAVPDDQRFELLCRIRAAQALVQGREVEREKLVIARLLAIAIFCHTHPETQASNTLFLYEPDLISHVAELLQLDRGVPIPVQTAAIVALDALARYRNKVQEVLAAVNAGVNHGILMALLRKTVNDVAQPTSTVPHAYVDALLAFVTFLASHAAGGNMVVGAGLIPLLIQIVENRVPGRLQMVSKTMQLLDNVLYGFTNAFQLFCNNKGVEVLTDRIEYEVDLGITEAGEASSQSRDLSKPYGQLPIARAAVLKHMLRSLHRMMQSSGTAEGLRGLIDSSILKSIKKIIEHRSLFGPSVLPIAINIMATFVHNEPTSLSIIQEAGLPEAFYKAVEAGVEPVLEVIQAVPNAIGALCLNQTGQDQLASRPTIIPGLFLVFTSERHLKVLQDKENAVLIGSAIDELIRHHPSLKASVFDAIKSTLGKIEDLGNAYVEPEGDRHWYKLGVTVFRGTSRQDVVPMEGVESEHSAGGEGDRTRTADEGSEGSTATDDDTRKHENAITQYIDVVGRFLEGLFQHGPHCKDLITGSDILAQLGRITALPCLPYDFSNSVSSDSLVQVLRTMAEVAPNETLGYLARIVKESMSETKYFWETTGSDSVLEHLVDISAEEEKEANAKFRNLITLHTRVNLLSEVYATAGFAHGRSAAGLLQAIMGPETSSIVPDMGALHRACVWENIVLKGELASRGMDVGLNSDPGSPTDEILPSLPTEENLNESGPSVAGGTRSSSQSASTTHQGSSVPDAAVERNGKGLHHIVKHMPGTLAPFFTAIVKLFYTRRMPEPTQKKQITDAAGVLADVMIKHLTQKIDHKKLASFAYHTVMLGLITILIIDERTTQRSLHTVLLLAFYRAGGIESIIDICRMFMAALPNTPVQGVDEPVGDDRKREHLAAYGGLKVALHLLLPIVSSKALFESGQTPLVITRGKNETDRDYFEPHNFLVRLRSATLPLIRDLWQAPWLAAAPVSLCKSVIQIVLQLVGGENEEAPDFGDLAGVPALPGAPSLSRPVGLDENRVRQLTDMGFPRSAAERALLRARNNINAATEMLLSHPFPLPPDPEPNEPAPAPAPNQNAPSEDVNMDTSDSNAEAAPQDASAPQGSANQEAEGQASNSTEDKPTDQPPVLVKTSQEWRKELDEARAPLKSQLGKQALRLVDEHPSLIFDVRNAFVGGRDTYQDDSVRQLIEDVKAFSPSAYDVQEQPLAVRCRLLALVLSESPSTVLRADNEGKKLMDVLLALLLSNPVSMEGGHPTVPKWLASHLLVTEALLAMAEEPRPVQLPKEGESAVQEALMVGPDYNEARSILFDFCLRLLGVPELPRDELLSALRMLVLLTRDHRTAAQFAGREGVQVLLKSIKSSSDVANVPGVRSYSAIIFRHIVETPGLLHQIMRQETKRLLSQSRSRLMDVSNYLKHCSPMAWRNPEIFLDVTESIAQLSNPYSPSRYVTLKSEPPSNGKEAQGAEAKEDSGVTKMEVDQPADRAVETGSNEAVDPLIHLLVSELVQVVKQAPEAPSSDQRETTAPAPQTPSASAAKDTDTSNAATTAINYTYARFLMQCLTELLFSYDSCKAAFLSYSSKRRSQGLARETSSKHRTAALQFLLSELVSYGTINSQSTSESRDRVMLCNCAMSVIVALCIDTSYNHDIKDVPQELASVRKTVLEAVNRAIKELSPSEGVDARYGRLLALAELCHRLLTVRFGTSGRKQQEESPTHVGKIMLEKNFVSTLTNALGEVDLNYPNVRGLVTALLRPLEHLTKIAIRMSRTSDRKEASPDQKPESVEDISSEDEDEEMEHSDREETPDLYRNSSLGMYGGEMEDANYAEEDMDEDEEDEEEDVDMEYGDETGSENTSVDADEQEEEELGDESGESEDEWEDAEPHGEEGLVENDDVEEDEDEDEDDQGEDEDGEDEDDRQVVWQNVPVGEGLTDELGEDAEEDDEEGHAPMIREEIDEEPEVISDAENFEELGVLETDDGVPPEMFGFDAMFPDGFAEAQDMFFPPPGRSRARRNAEDDMVIFGRSRTGPAPPSEAVTHPLLVDAPSMNNGSSNQGRGSRRTNRGIGDMLTQDGMLQALEDFMGGGAIQIFQHVIAPGRGGALPETIRVNGTLLNVERGHIHRHPRGALAASLRLERAPRDSRSKAHDFDPLVTLSRWAEEGRIMHGRFATERVNKLSNRLILKLLPAAIEALREEKAKAEQLEAERQAAQAKAAAEEAAREAEAADDLLRMAREQVEPMSTDSAASAPDAPDTEPSQIQSSDGDTEMVDATNEPPTSESRDDGPDAPPSAEAAPAPEAGPSSEAQSSTSSQRVTVMIHGSAVDITDTGIDPTFLEALPDDMREEVVNQHVREQRAARVERPADSQISPEFLEALPPDIRAEIIQQENIERARHRVVDQAQRAPGGPAEIDPASFIASLDPHLRQAVLLDSDDGFIQTLPSHMVAEAGVYRDGSHRRPPPQLAVRSPNARSPPTRRLPAPRDAIQLLDKAGIIILARLLFFPQVLKKNLLFQVLVNLCENSKTRTELFNLLLSILHDGSGDLAAIDKSFAQMSFRNTRTPAPQTPKAFGKQRTNSDYLSTLSLPQHEAVPEVIAQRCLEALSFIVNSSELFSLFFLTEHELPAGLRRSALKKGKGKEKQASQTHHPVVLLLGLLDRQSLLKTPSIMESVVGLLATISRLLATVKDLEKKVKQQNSASTTTASSTDTSSAAAVAAPSAQSSVQPVVDTNSGQSSGGQPPQDIAKVPEPTPEEKILMANPPQIPHTVLRLVVNILTAGECSGRTFQQSLALIQHLSYIPDAREVIAQELRTRAQDLGQTLYQDLDELANVLTDSQGDVLASSVASRFASASSDQAKLLRVLKTIDYMYSSKSGLATETDEEKVQSIYESFRFTPLWRRLGDCLSIIEEKPDLEHIATVLLPLIESLMVVCKYVGSKPNNGGPARLIRSASSPRSPTTPRETMEGLFTAFTDAHRKVLNLMVRNNPSLMSGSFSLLVNNPRVLDFDNKRNYFNQQLRRRPHTREHYGTLQLNVRRQRVFEDSVQYLQRKTGDQIKYGKLSVRFYDEEGVDAGGVTREWFQILARQMFDPNNALFQPCAADKLTYQPNSRSAINPEHLTFFKFVGRVIGKAIYDGRLLDAYFARSLYRQILGKPVDYRDVEWVDPEYYNSLCWILENDPSPLELTFSVEIDEFGIMKVIPLKEGGTQIPVTQENKREFVQLSAQYRLYSSTKDQIDALLGGFYEIIPKDLIAIFNEQELELLISGTPDIDVDEWRAATEYHGYTSSDPVIVWWWRALKSFNRDERAKVLSFATGTARVPLGGFTELQGVQGTQRFSIHKAYGDADRLPQAHTCFNQIDLPQYSSYEMLRQQLLLAINEGGEGFGFA